MKGIKLLFEISLVLMSALQIYSLAGVNWIQSFHLSDHNNKTFSIAPGDSENVCVTGRSGIAGSYVYATNNYTSARVQGWVPKYYGPGSGGTSIAVNNSGDVHVTGYSGGSTFAEYSTIKYLQSTAIQAVSIEVPENFSLSQNYPNPFNPDTKIKFQIKKPGVVSLKVFDILGNEVATIINDKLIAGIYEESFDGTGLSSGVYFYKLKAEALSKTKRMTLIKE